MGTSHPRTEVKSEKGTVAESKKRKGRKEGALDRIPYVVVINGLAPGHLFVPASLQQIDQGKLTFRLLQGPPKPYTPTLLVLASHLTPPVAIEKKHTQTISSGGIPNS